MSVDTDVSRVCHCTSGAFAADVDCCSSGTAINCDTWPEDDTIRLVYEATILTLPAIVFAGAYLDDVSCSSV